MRIIFLFTWLLAIYQQSTLACGNENGQVAEPTRDWWQSAQFYQIYPRSFKDSDGDGIGDLAGIASKLDYLKDLGVTAVWLSPIYSSPMADFGYDISDFFDIQPEYGTLDDFDNLLKEAQKRGLKLILDFVPNHSSDESEWFKKSVNREKGYEDYYIWHDGYLDEQGNRVPPNNWIQQFRGSAWEWNEQRQQYYLHQFAVKQPDLNYRNPAVVAQMNRVLTYWLDRGVSGFRVDAVPWCFEVDVDENGRYPDEPLSGNTDDQADPSYLKHIYTQDLPETIDLVYQWRQLLKDYQRIHGGETRVLLTEAFSSLDYIMQFYGNSTFDGAQMPFNFQFILGGNGDQNNTQLRAPGFVRIINSWLDKMPPGQTANWVMGNHDQRRVGSRYGVERIDLMNMLQTFLPGVSITYMGEEIGMTDLNISWEDSRDTAACNSNPEIYQTKTRDPARTPFQWSNTDNAGFSTNSTTWLPINPNYVNVNVETEMSAPKSHYTIYRQLVDMRQLKTIQQGGVKLGALGDNMLAIKRSLKNEKTYILLANVWSDNETADVTDLLRVSGQFKTLISNMHSSRNVGDMISAENVPLRPYEAIILESA